MKKFLLIFFVVIATVIGVAIYNLETIVKVAVDKYGSEITGTKVSLEGFKLSPKQGAISISKISVANPAGYKSANIFSLENITVDVDTKALLKGAVVVDEILIKKPVITVEALSLTKNNVMALQKNIENNLSKSSEKKPVTKTAKTSEKDTSSSTSFLIKKFVLAKATAQVYLPNMKPKSVVVPEIVLTNLDGNIKERIAKVLTKMIDETMNSFEKLAKEELKKIAQENINQVKEKVTEKAKEGILKLRDKFGF